MRIFSAARKKCLLCFIIVISILNGIFVRWRFYTRAGSGTMNKRTLSDRSSLGNYCPPLWQSGRWLKVSDFCYILSAYIDARPVNNTVRIIGVYSRWSRGILDGCHLFFPGENIPERAKINVDFNSDDHNLTFIAVIISCIIPSHRQHDKPCAVKILCKNTKQMDPIPVHTANYSTKRNYTVCVPPLRNYKNIYQLVDMFEANKLFGANHYIIYNMSTSDDVNKYLSYYIKKNMVTLIPWNPPEVVLEIGIHYYGQLAAVNDCYYRNRIASKYIVFMDMDEVIVPRKSSTWDDMLAGANKFKHRKTEGSYMIRSKFFQPCEDRVRKNQNQNVQADAKHLGMYTIRYQKCLPHIFRFRVRSKLIIGPDAAIHIGVHVVWKYMRGYRNTNVDPAIGLVHHYRIRSNCKARAEPDNYMDRFANQLIEQVKHVHKHVGSA